MTLQHCCLWYMAGLTVNRTCMSVALKEYGKHVDGFVAGS